MDLSPGVVIVIAVAAVAGFAVIRWGRHQAEAPHAQHPSTPAGGNVIAPGTARESQPLVVWLLERAFEQTGVRVENDAIARARIEEAAGKAMDELRAGGSTTISLPFLVADARGPRHFNVEFKRNMDSSFEELP